jgi:hypothetical protein
MINVNSKAMFQKLSTINEGLLKILIVWVFGVFIYGIAGAQMQDTSLPKKEFRITLQTVMYQKLHVTSGNEAGLFRSRDAPSGILSIAYSYRLKHNFTIEPMVGLTVVPVNYNFELTLKEDHPLHKPASRTIESNRYDYFVPSGRLGLFVTKEFKIRKESNWFAGFCVQRNTFPTYGFQLGERYQTKIDGIDSSIQLFNLSMEGGESGKYWFNNFSYGAKLGYTKRNINKNGFSIGLVVNYQPQPIGLGEYTFDLWSSLDVGSVSWKNSYYGLQFSWNFSLNKKSTVWESKTRNKS